MTSTGDQKPRYDLAEQVKTLGADSLLPPVKLTKRQAEGLRRIRDHGPQAWDTGIGRAGGAVGRMFCRLAKLGMCSHAPYTITQYGSDVLDTFDGR